MKKEEKEIRRILEQMNKAEKDALEIIGISDSHCWYPVIKCGFNDYRIKSNKNGLLSLTLMHQGRMSNPDYFSSAKIPLNYFEMTDKDVYETHKIWSKAYMKQRKERELKALIERSKSEIKKLKSDINKMTEKRELKLERILKGGK